MLCESYDGPARGAGDVIYNLTVATGLKAMRESKLAVAVLGDCKCGQKRQEMNAKYPSKDNRNAQGV